MKIQLNFDEQYQEVEVHIHANKLDDEVQKIINQLKTPSQNMIDGYINQEICMLKASEIYTIYVEKGKVFLQTDEEEYQSKKKLYEIEEIFQKQFSRVNKSTLVNIDHIRSFQMDLVGTTLLILDNGTSVHVSRKYFKELKKKLGIGKEV
ncbi:LytTR family transcriptional regulator [Rummeliibacillus sp. TYF005]|uniref:LytTR family DNA-binding domain-containing protein n=1 Tax=unclassified Rummeliibacillus TaxID=2622809 RepID=UPI000E66D69A|nr:MULTISPECIES: LytTR family DNA-binding domain-containing protein [unclassified Rummeliibacillus]RIJ63559.1 LytTR family transcriptional regulator [Rummeliibacillus sp. POC4]RPJ94948.1 LytTR family transcriptional regulator [Rummeliibacillus sp. TYF005]